MPSPLAVLPGLLLATSLAICATFGGKLAPVVGAPVLALILGAVFSSAFKLPAALGAGFSFAGKQILQAAIVVSGLGLSFGAALHIGLATLPVTLATIAVALCGAALLGRALRLDGSIRTLIGVGTAICGASAIAAVATVIEPTEAELALSVATIFFFNVVAVLLFPPIGHLLGLSQHAFGVWAGTAINDTSSVVAAGYVYGHVAGAEATIVKLTRATLILPIVAVIAFGRAHRNRNAAQAVPWAQIVPWFIAWFLLAAVLNSIGIIPAGWHPATAEIAAFLITVALAAIGLETRISTILRGGIRPLALGLCLWVAVAVTSLAIQFAAGE